MTNVDTGGHVSAQALFEGRPMGVRVEIVGDRDGRRTLLVLYSILAVIGRTSIHTIRTIPTTSRSPSAISVGCLGSVSSTA